MNNYCYIFDVAAGRRDEGMEGIQLGDEDLGPVDITHEEALRRGRDEILMRYATRGKPLSSYLWNYT